MILLLSLKTKLGVQCQLLKEVTHILEMLISLLQQMGYLGSILTVDSNIMSNRLLKTLIQKLGQAQVLV